MTKTDVLNLLFLISFNYNFGVPAPRSTLELGIFKKELAGVLIKTISPWKITIKIKLEKLTPYLNLKCNTLTYLAEGAPWQAK